MTPFAVSFVAPFSRHRKHNPHPKMVNTYNYPDRVSNVYNLAYGRRFLSRQDRERGCVLHLSVLLNNQQTSNSILSLKIEKANGRKLNKWQIELDCRTLAFLTRQRSFSASFAKRKQVKRWRVNWHSPLFTISEQKKRERERERERRERREKKETQG